MHHYKIAQDAIETAVGHAGEHAWSEQEELQSLIVSAIERHVQVAGAKNTSEMLKFELSNLSATVDFDFVRSR